MLGLCWAGLVILYSAGYNPDTGESLAMYRQLYAMGIGLASFFICMYLSSSFWRQATVPVYLAGILLLGYILFEGVIAGGAQRWIEMHGFRMQPSEFMKIGIILAMAKILSSEKAPKDGYGIFSLFVPLMVLLFPAVLTFVEPDLGTAVCHVLIGGSMILLAGVRRKALIWLFACAVGFGVTSWSYLLMDYQRARVATFLWPESDPMGRGYHALQSKIAVGSGMLTGKGFLKGTQTQLRFMPEQTTDFIFSVLAEEWGFIGSVVILLLYGMLLFRLLKISLRLSDLFAVYVTFGVAAMIFWHVLVNIGMVAGIVPVVGITLVMLSYGGSSIVTCMSLLGIVAGFSRRRFVFS